VGALRPRSACGVCRPRIPACRACRSASRSRVEHHRLKIACSAPRRPPISAWSHAFWDAERRSRTPSNVQGGSRGGSMEDPSTAGQARPKTRTSAFMRKQSRAAAALFAVQRRAGLRIAHRHAAGLTAWRHACSTDPGRRDDREHHRAVAPTELRDRHQRNRSGALTPRG
jgi:hypothetical protein